MYAIIENGLVIDSAVADEIYAQKKGWVLMPIFAGIGWSYIDGVFVDNRPVPDTPIEVAPSKEDLLAQITALMLQVQALA
jgi:hypothetical protein